MPESKLSAPQRLQLALGANIFEVEAMRDRIEQLTAQLAERDATIAQLLSAARPATPDAPRCDELEEL